MTSKKRAPQWEPYLCPERFVLRGQGEVLAYVTRGDVQAEGLSLVTIRGSLDGILARPCILWAKRFRTILGEHRRTNGQAPRVGAGIEIGCLRFYGHLRTAGGMLCCDEDDFVSVGRVQ